MCEEEAGKVRIRVRRMYMWRNVICAHVLKVGWRPRTVNSGVIKLVGRRGWERGSLTFVPPSFARA